MKNVLKHKGYVARIDFDADDCIFAGRIVGIEDVIGFHSHTSEGLIEAFHEAVDDYVETCAKAGKEPDKPYSGKVFLRVDPSIHARVAIAAKMSGKSINQFGAEVLEKAAEQLIPV